MVVPLVSRAVRAVRDRGAAREGAPDHADPVPVEIPVADPRAAAVATIAGPALLVMVEADRNGVRPAR